MIEKLNALSNAWKQQFSGPHGNRGMEKLLDATPDIPLKWEVDKDGMVLLDGIWVCPARCVNLERVDACAEWVNPVAMELPLTDGFMNIVIIHDHGRFEIYAMERQVVHCKD